MKKRSAKFYEWATRKATSPSSSIWMSFLFSLELILLIPLDPILMFFCLQNRKRIFSYIWIAAAGSTLSAFVGYLFGHFLWDLVGPYIVPYFISPALFHRLSSHFQEYENWAIFFGSLLPFPLKALSLSAGVFHLKLFPFLSSLFAARLLRFTLVGSSMAVWGHPVKEFIDRHFHRIFLILGVKIAAAFFFIWILAR